MTCRYTNTDWLDILYNDVRRSPGGIVDAARYLTERRGRSIHPESLRAKLRGLEGESISLEMAELLTERLEDLNREDHLAWLHAYCARWGLYAVQAHRPTSNLRADLQDLVDDGMKLFEKGGKLAGLINNDVKDGKISPGERDEIVAAVDDVVRLLMHARQLAISASEKEVR